MVRNSILLIAVFLSLSYSSLAQHQQADSTAKPPREQFDPQRDADNDIRQAIDEATHSGRKILLDVGGEWCIWCKRLDGFFGTHRQAYDLLHTTFVVVKVNYSKENKNEAVLSRYPKIPGYPHMFILDASGTLLHSQDTGLLEEGKGYSETKIMTFLEHWAAANGGR